MYVYVCSWGVTVTGLDGLKDHPSDAVAVSQEHAPPQQYQQQQPASTGLKGTGRRAKMAQATSSFIDLGSSSSSGVSTTASTTTGAVRVRGRKTKAVDYNDDEDEGGEDGDVINKRTKR